MKYFKKSDFRGWYDKMDPELLEVMERFAESVGKKMFISPANGAIGRRLSPPNKSFHNVSHWGMVKAIDIMIEGLETGDDYRRVFEAAKEAGALGIGVYPDWRPVSGVHLDMGERKGRGPGNPAKWSAFRVNGRQKYFAVDKSFNL